ncbi:hypothetical protein ACHAPQ_012169, partial [Fusarium lateritium]
MTYGVELPDSRNVRILVALFIAWAVTVLLTLVWKVYTFFLHRPELPDPNAQSVEENLIEGMEKYTHITTIRPEIPAAIRQELTRDISNIIPAFEDEMDYAAQYWPKSGDWTTLSLYEMM